jgi:hypothetical protein
MRVYSHALCWDETIWRGGVEEWAVVRTGSQLREIIYGD